MFKLIKTLRLGLLAGLFALNAQADMLYVANSSMALS
jgi:hypothetical protein